VPVSWAGVRPSAGVVLSGSGMTHPEGVKTGHRLLLGCRRLLAIY